uniref:Uncharacterized protein n=1 Tax=Psilocybe cubensis TaxID=181762 RepID=A0A8H8CHY5_PSICU
MSFNLHYGISGSAALRMDSPVSAPTAEPTVFRPSRHTFDIPPFDLDLDLDAQLANPTTLLEICDQTIKKVIVEGNGGEPNHQETITQTGKGCIPTATLGGSMAGHMFSSDREGPFMTPNVNPSATQYTVFTSLSGEASTSTSTSFSTSSPSSIITSSSSVFSTSSSSSVITLSSSAGLGFIPSASLPSISTLFLFPPKTSESLFPTSSSIPKHTPLPSFKVSGPPSSRSISSDSLTSINVITSTELASNALTNHPHPNLSIIIPIVFVIAIIYTVTFVFVIRTLRRRRATRMLTQATPFSEEADLMKNSQLPAGWDLEQRQHYA